MSFATVEASTTDPWEISDLVVAYDPETLARRRVRKDEVVETLKAQRLVRGARIVARWPAEEGYLVESFVDAVLLRAHHELQRLSEEFRQGERAARLLRPLLAALRASGHPPPYRVVDVGCGLGYVVRWLAAWGRLGPDVALVGCDYNAPLLGLAAALAAEERLACRFTVGNAFRLSEPATIYLSTGVIHHFRGPALASFLAAQMLPRAEASTAAAQAFLHTDIKPTYLAPAGAWIFHLARMHEPLARHDGVLSALRAHHGATLLAEAARQGARAGWQACLFDGRHEALPLLKVMQTLVGVRRGLGPLFVEALGPLRARLGGWTGEETAPAPSPAGAGT